MVTASIKEEHPTGSMRIYEMLGVEYTVRVDDVEYKKTVYGLLRTYKLSVVTPLPSCFDDGRFELAVTDGFEAYAGWILNVV